MYNRYLDQNCQPLSTPSPKPTVKENSCSANRPSDPLRDATDGLGTLLGKVFHGFSVEQLDGGDILLVLIILFIFLEGDNLELVITLALMLLLGLGEDQSASGK